ncbi:PKD domain-containing protein [Kitasatospora sp. NBC_00315]|uniref:PKD domain-containing protein n=1 Tax=Kitasatospora sp. NBC_00315 TaxID=2975963 RepID=UPI003247693A
MRLRHAVGLAAATVSAVVGLPTVASGAEPASVLYVDNAAAAHCLDGGAGTQAQPYCTIQAAADAARPGQTVQVAPGADLAGGAKLTHSGSPGHPIVINGSPLAPLDSSGMSGQPSLHNESGHVLELSGVTDVIVRGFDIYGTADPILVTGSSRIELDQNIIEYSGTAPLPGGSAAVRLSGANDHVTVSRSIVYRNAGIVVETGSQHTTIVGNSVSSPGSTALTVTDAPGTVLTNNTLVGLGAGLDLRGASPGSVIENNIVIASATRSSVAPVSVSADSVPGTTMDYNIVHRPQPGDAYAWGGTGYPAPAAFTAGTGQGSHDSDADVPFDGVTGLYPMPTDAATAAVDSGDPAAPGLPDTDMFGKAVVDDPLVANTGPGGGVRDRGAFEVQGLRYASLNLYGVDHPAPGPQGPGPLVVELTAYSSTRWPTVLHYTFDFGDGSAPLVTTDKTVRHTYSTVGRHPAKVTVTDGIGGSVASPDGSWVTVNPDGPVVPTLDATPNGTDPLGFRLDTGGSSPWGIRDYAVDFGDGSSDSRSYSGFTHTYGHPGTYTVRLTVTDFAGRSASTTRQVTAAYAAAGFTAITPARVLDTRVPGSRNEQHGAWSSIDVNVRSAQANGSAAVVPAGATAVVINLTATGGSGTGFLAAGPNRGERPATSNVNYGPGQDVANVVTVPIGADGNVTITNSTGAVGAVADVLGYYRADSPAKYTAVTPARLLDTRAAGDSPLGQDRARSLKVTGAGVPADAGAVVLNVTSTDATADSHLIVYPTGANRPAASNLNFGPGRTVPNQVIVPVGADGSIDLYNHLGSTDVIVDVFGYYGPDGGGLFTPVTPARLLDTRLSGGALGQGASRSVGGVPAGATAAVVNITATGTTTDTHLIVHATGTALPGTSNLNPVPGRDVPNQVTTPVGADGRFDVFNHMGSTQVIADLFGYFTNG